jgi:cysteine desulfurase
MIPPTPADPIYFDNAATTRPHPSVVAAMAAALETAWANPSSRHPPGLAARRLIEDARSALASYSGIEPEGVVFTSGGTEANQLAALGLPLRSRATRIVTTNAEHPSLARPLRARPGAEIVEVALGGDGAIDLERLASALDERVGLVALFDGHNEIGSRNPLDAIVPLVRSRSPRALIHVDSVQALGKPSPPPFAAGIDSAAISAHKIHGPKGAGALLLRTRTTLAPQLLGGGQEHDRRSGTENVPGIAGLGQAVRLLAAATAADHAALLARRDRLLALLRAALPEIRPLCDGPRSLPHILALVIPGVLAEPLLHHLEGDGICASAGAACHAGTKEVSPALRAAGLREDEVRSVVRLSLSRQTTDAEVDFVAERLPALARKLRALGATR